MLDGKKLRTLLCLAISAGLLLYLYRTYFSGAKTLEIHWNWFLLGAALSLTINYGLGALKWGWVLRLHGIQLPRRDLFKLWIGLYPMSFLFPFQTGSLLYVRAIEKRAGTSFGLAFRAVVFDKGLNVIAVLVLIVIGQLILDPSHSLSHPLILIGAATPVLLFLFVNLKRVTDRLPEGWQKPRQWLQGLDIGVGAGRKAKLLALASVYQSTDIISALVAGFAVKANPDPNTVLGVFPVILLLSYVPVAFQGFGTREALAVLWLGGVFSPAEATTLGFLVSMMEYAVPAAFGLVCIGFALSVISPRNRTANGDFVPGPNPADPSLNTPKKTPSSD